MDAEALRMLADLGLERRDVVSAPDEVPKGRHYREDPREQAAIAAAFEARRKQNSRDDVGGGDERAACLRAWNSTCCQTRENKRLTTEQPKRRLRPTT